MWVEPWCAAFPARFELQTFSLHSKSGSRDLESNRLVTEGASGRFILLQKGPPEDCLTPVWDCQLRACDKKGRPQSERPQSLADSAVVNRANLYCTTCPICPALVANCLSPAYFAFMMCVSAVRVEVV